jgi:transmembrane sensor
MDELKHRFDYLLHGYANKMLSASEQEEFLHLLEDHWKQIQSDNEEKHVDWEGMLNEIVHSQTPHQVQKVHILRKKWLRYAAAVILFMAIGGYWWSNNSKTNKTPADSVVSIEVDMMDLPPGGNKAILTLADGSTIVLDSAANGNLAQQGSMQVVKKSNGELEYKTLGKNGGDSEVRYNTMSTPIGGQFKLQLPDGSRVWLNALSSITFPTSFTGNERVVNVSGEVYFEVAKNENMPFKVQVNGIKEIEVLGTHFNVNAYKEESGTTTTLLEGSVKIGNSVLKPGEAYHNGMVEKADISRVVAWKNGLFVLDNLSLKKLLPEISRWYDVEVVYEKIPEIKLWGKMGRDLNLSQVLVGLRDMGLHCRLENGKRLIILP